MAKDVISYLNEGSLSPFYSKLDAALAKCQPRAQAGQWVSILGALTSKGVSQREINESGVLPWLKEKQPNEFVSCQELRSEVQSRGFILKEVQLGSPQFKGYSQNHQNGQYQELLYIVTSESGYLTDKLDEVEARMADLSFTPELYMQEPQVVIEIEEERAAILNKMQTSIDFKRHHYDQKVMGQHGKNLLAHARVIFYPQTGAYLIQEIQSDWAQKYRADKANAVPKGPLIENTESWTRLVLARALQLAALNPAVKTVSWITESMRNGGRQNIDGEKAKVTQKAVFDAAMKELIETKMQAANDSLQLLNEQQREQHVQELREQAKKELASKGVQPPYDMLNDYYLKVMPKLADALIKGTGEKVALQTIVFDKEYLTATVPTIAITPSVREQLTQQQISVYSRANLVKESVSMDDPILYDILQDAATMLGSAKHLRLYKQVYDHACKPVAGKFVNDLVQVSLSAKDIKEALNHECFHFAQKHILSHSEMDIVRSAFADGTLLRRTLVDSLNERGDYGIAKDCETDINEACAQGFAMWKEGRLEVKEEPVVGIFSGIVNAVQDVTSWIKEKIFEQEHQTVEDVFEAFASGRLAQREIDALSKHHIHTHPMSVR